jgi:hypothetical protein
VYLFAQYVKGKPSTITTAWMILAQQRLPPLICCGNGRDDPASR